MNSTFITLAEKALLPDWLIRKGIRILNRRRLRGEASRDSEAEQERKAVFIRQLRKSPIAYRPEKPNEQHYEIPAEFYRYVLGTRMKYSCALWEEGVHSLDAAEEAMLDLTCRRAGIRDGMDILDLGCGWGSLSLWIAEHFSGSRIVAVSNSLSQREFIQRLARESGGTDIEVVTADVNEFTTHQTFDIVLSVEMFEHMRNYRLLLARISRWLKPEGRLFVHMFCHRKFSYIFETVNEDDWMSTYFFTAGLMPSDDLLLYFQDDLCVQEHWIISGMHYMKTAEAWLRNLDLNKAAAGNLFSAIYGKGEESLWLQRWRIFFMACSELFGFRHGQEWWVAHYLFNKKKP